MGFLTHLLRRLRADQAGVTMVEVLVSALVLAILSTGVLAGLDGAQNISNKSRQRSVAASLAQADQERLRGFRAKELSNLREAARPKTLDGTTYSIQSTSDWVSDASGAAECSGSGARADYMRIRSSVTWANMGGLKPITLDSIVAAPTGSFGTEGTIGVRIADRDDAGISGMSVTVTGAKTLTGTTNGTGCVLFGYLPAGQYTVTFSRSGYITPAGVTNVSDTATVSSEETVILPYQYDRPGTATAAFTTRKGPTAAVQNVGSSYALGANSGLPAGFRSFGTGTNATSIALTNLFPFSDPYSVFSAPTNTCTGANPALATYASTAAVSNGVSGFGTSGSSASGQAQAPAATAYATVPQGGSAGTVTVREPSLRVFFRTGSGTNDLVAAPVGTTVKATPTMTGCSGTNTFTTDADGWVSSPDAGLAVGTYTLCWEYYYGAWYKQVQSGVKIQDPNGVEVRPTALPASGRC